MTLMLNLSEVIENRLKSEAERRGLPAPDLALQFIEAALHPDAQTQIKLNQPSLDLLTQWQVESGTQDPDEILRRKREWEQFASAMNSNRLESDGSEARIPYP